MAHNFSFCVSCDSSNACDICNKLDGLKEQRHAYWFDVGASGGYCSACKHKSRDMGLYCQNCGAKMDARRP